MSPYLSFTTNTQINMIQSNIYYLHPLVVFNKYLMSADCSHKNIIMEPVPPKRTSVQLVNGLQPKQDMTHDDSFDVLAAYGGDEPDEQVTANQPIAAVRSKNKVVLTETVPDMSGGNTSASMSPWMEFLVKKRNDREKHGSDESLHQSSTNSSQHPLASG